MDKNPNHTILVVEDDEGIRKMVRMFLEVEQIKVLESEEGGQALQILSENVVDLVILDLMMPGLDGWTTCRKIREVSDVPIIFLTARGEESERILGFELGADDYVVKPFSPRELVLRVRALLKRRQSASPSSISSGNQVPHSAESNELVRRFPELEIYPEGHKVLIKQQLAPLTPLEYALFTYLAAHPGRVFSRDHLLNQVWGYDYGGDSRTVDTHIRRLREKLAAFSERVAGYITTVRGAGYKFEVEP